MSGPIMTVDSSKGFYLNACFPVTQGNFWNAYSLNLTIITIMFLFFCFFLFNFWIRKHLEAIYILYSRIDQIDPKNPIWNFDKITQVGYLSSLENSLSHLIKGLSESKNQVSELEVYRVVSKISSQVAHDIRSPLAALEMFTDDLSGLPEESRLVIRSAVGRIRDIANDLLIRNKALKSGNLDAEKGTLEKPSIELLQSILEPILTEKRLQYRAKLGVEIEGKFDVESYGIFSKIQVAEFKRAISNLINNSVEALSASGRILVDFRSQNNSVKLRISDNGKGIPPEILAKLCQMGETYGKDGGSGLGLFHAKSTFQNWGGDLTIESTVGIGTTISVTFQKAETPLEVCP